MLVRKQMSASEEIYSFSDSIFADAENKWENVKFTIAKETSGFVATATIDYIEYISDPEDMDIIRTMGTNQFAEMHKLFPPSAWMIGDAIMLRYDLTFLQLQLTFAMKKKDLTPLEEVTIECRRSADKIAELSATVAELKAKVAELEQKS